MLEVVEHEQHVFMAQRCIADRDFLGVERGGTGILRCAIEHRGSPPNRRGGSELPFTRMGWRVPGSDVASTRGVFASRSAAVERTIGKVRLCRNGDRPFRLLTAGPKGNKRCTGPAATLL